MATYEEQVDLLLAEDVDAVKERERTAFDRLLAEADGRIVLFGAGNLGRKALRCLRSVGIEPLAFADNAAARWGSQADGVDVLSPEEAADKFRASAMFMVTIWSLGHTFRETHAKLKSLGCRTVLSSSSLRWKFAGELLPDYCQDLPHKLYEQADEVRMASRLWADDESRSEYLSQIQWRALGDMGALRAQHQEESYFLDTLFEVERGEVFVDCGAYIGNTALRVVERNGEFGRIIAVEADPANFLRLQQWIAGVDADVRKRIVACPVAVGSERGQLRFKATGGEGACLSDDGDTVVDCIPLDELTKGEAPTFIKMDIEGAEFDSLMGARQVIERYRPVLATCVYHIQCDIWRIPLLIRNFSKEYRFFLRHHDGDGWQTVCYAVPPHRLRGAAEVHA